MRKRDLEVRLRIERARREACEARVAELNAAALSAAEVLRHVTPIVRSARLVVEAQEGSGVNVADALMGLANAVRAERRERVTFTAPESH